MACQGCINRQKWLVEKVCRKPDSAMCRRAQLRLERMLARQKTEETKK
jgi:hypothetical protein